MAKARTPNNVVDDVIRFITVDAYIVHLTSSHIELEARTGGLSAHFQVERGIPACVLLTGMVGVCSMTRYGYLEGRAEESGQAVWSRKHFQNLLVSDAPHPPASQLGHCLKVPHVLEFIEGTNNGRVHST